MLCLPSDCQGERSKSQRHKRRKPKDRRAHDREKHNSKPKQCHHNTFYSAVEPEDRQLVKAYSLNRETTAREPEKRWLSVSSSAARKGVLGRNPIKDNRVRPWQEADHSQDASALPAQVSLFPVRQKDCSQTGALARHLTEVPLLRITSARCIARWCEQGLGTSAGWCG